MIEINKEILIEENELLKLENEKLKKDIKSLELSFRRNLAKSSDLMIKLIKVQAGVSYCKKFNYSTDENFKKGWNKAFELVEKCFKSGE